ncbi:N-acetylmuramoyl-L-alanine amidase [Clostridium perfringens]|uniref:N-acetylmuramoyl-L-alanine amidase n=1 Tax=Clostridium perfringens TaxID=1502 RepID=UPI001F054712|nr:N-acetylmuramoyl-L-alanine amidase [Clostridium perfringens]
MVKITKRKISFIISLFMIFSIISPRLVYADNVPKIAIDNMVNGSNFPYNKKIMRLSGWAINTSGIKKIEVYVNNKYKGDAKIGYDRIDIGKAYPNYKDSNKSGFIFDLDLTGMDPGVLNITIRQLGNDGSVNDKEIGINYLKAEPITVIETLKDGQTVSSSLKKVKLSGWALNSSGVKKVEVYLNGKYQGDASIGHNRPDIGSAYPEYIDSKNSGFVYNLDLNNIKPGINNIIVKQIGNDGSSNSKNIKINYEKQEPITAIETFQDGQSIATSVKQVQLSGWALNSSGVKKVEIYLNGKYQGDASIGHNRPDIGASYPEYTDSYRSGYVYTLNLNNMRQGEFNIMVKQIGNDDSINSKNIKLKYMNLKPIIAMDTFKNGQNIGPNIRDLQLSGWAINASGIKKVEIYLNGKYQGDASIGYSRPDIKAAYPEYLESGKSGYVYNLNLNNTPPGVVDVTIRQYGNDDSVETLNFGFNFFKKDSKINIESPIKNDNIKDKVMNVSGWALNDSGVKKVEVYLDGKYIKDANIGFERKDIGSAYSEYLGAKNSGFSVSIDLNGVSLGNKELKVKAIGNDGTTQIREQNIRIINSKLIVVDPGHNYGGDYGAESTIDGVTYRETELDMFIAVKLKKELEKQGYSVVLTRQPFERPTDDLVTSISKRVDLANKLNADAFISLHHDSSSSIMAKGISTFYSSWKSGLDNTDIVDGKDPNGYDWYDLKVDLTPTKQALIGKDLAREIARNISGNANYNNRKEHDRNLGVTKRTNMPAVLVECGFITNPEEAKKAADPNNQQKIAESIAESVKNIIK